MTATDAPIPTRIAYVTGTRADLNLLVPTLTAIRADARLRLDVIATAMHLDARHGPPLDALRRAGIRAAGIVPWPASPTPSRLARATGAVMSRLAGEFTRLETDVLLVLGDRPEAFAAASAAHLAGLHVAHVHGGDRAQGQVDDALRHAITKLSHLHLVATPSSARRVRRLGERPETIHIVGAPGLEGITTSAATPAQLRRALPGIRPSESAVVLLHPESPDPAVEARRAAALLAGLSAAGVTHHILLAPNSDPGAAGIRETWGDATITDLPRPIFLALLRDCALLAGNSSAGVIESASFGIPTLDVGPRQRGRERGANVVHCGYTAAAVTAGVRTLLARGRRPTINPWQSARGGEVTSVVVTRLLAQIAPGSRPARKLIAF